MHHIKFVWRVLLTWLPQAEVPKPGSCHPQTSWQIQGWDRHALPILHLLPWAQTVPKRKILITKNGGREDAMYHIMKCTSLMPNSVFLDCHFVMSYVITILGHLGLVQWLLMRTLTTEFGREKRKPWWSSVSCLPWPQSGWGGEITTKLCLPVCK